MTITASQIKMYRSAVINNTTTNGGRMSISEVISGALKNVFPTINEAERAAGSIRYRKVFWKLAHPDNEALVEPKVYFDTFTPGGDALSFFPATQTDTQDDITGSEYTYGCGKLDASIVADDVSLTIEVEDAADHGFDIGVVIRVADGTNEEYVEITSSAEALGIVTVGFTPAIANSYSESNTKVSAVYEPGVDLEATISALVVTSAGGDLALENIIANGEGSVEQIWTLTFTTASAFNIVGDTLGSVGSGNVSAGAAPVNADFGEPYFTAQPGGFSGTFIAGDTIVFETHPSSIPLWIRREVPAACPATVANNADLSLDGETAGA